MSGSGDRARDEFVFGVADERGLDLQSQADPRHERFALPVDVRSRPRSVGPQPRTARPALERVEAQLDVDEVGGATVECAHADTHSAGVRQHQRDRRFERRGLADGNQRLIAQGKGEHRVPAGALLEAALEVLKRREAGRRFRVGPLARERGLRIDLAAQ